MGVRIWLAKLPVFDAVVQHDPFNVETRCFGCKEPKTFKLGFSEDRGNGMSGTLMVHVFVLNAALTLYLDRSSRSRPPSWFLKCCHLAVESSSGLLKRWGGQEWPEAVVSRLSLWGRSDVTAKHHSCSHDNNLANVNSKIQVSLFSAN